MQPSFDSISLDPVHWNIFSNNKINVSVLRLDKIHSLISGNKWFKLRYYMEDALKLNKTTIITFGGAYSNHILATAAACQLYNLSSVGIIRGENMNSPTLSEAKKLGMKLSFITRKEYATKKIPDQLINDDTYLIPEGGYGIKGAAGAATIAAYLKEPFSHICCSVGTGTMMAGLINAGKTEMVIGISSQKNNLSLEQAVSSLLTVTKKPVTILHDYHFGGYARFQPSLIQFMNDFFSQTGIPTDFVYTGKLFFAIDQLAAKGYFPVGSNIVVIHSGGLQGNVSLKKGTLIF